MMVIETRPHRWGWNHFEASGVEAVFPKKDQANDYAENRAAKKLLFHYKSPWAVKKYAVRLMPEFTNI
jgi:hypothetical protein